MAIRTIVAREIGPLRNKISVNLSDEEKTAVERVGFKVNASDAGTIRVLILEALYARGERVTAHEYMDLETVAPAAKRARR